MNYQNFNQTGGFPIKTQVLNDLQVAFSIFNAFGYISGDFSIISGCIVNGSSVTDGVVFINGEILPFQGGQIGTNVIIIENITQREFKNSQTKDVLFERYATFGIGLVSFPWSSFSRPKNTCQLTTEVAQIANKVNVSDFNNLIARVAVLEALPQNPIKNKGSFILGDIYPSGSSAGTSFTCNGDCVSAILLPDIDSGNSYVEVTFLNVMPSSNFNIFLSVESLGNINNDNDIAMPVGKVVANNKFRFGIAELSSTSQSIKINFLIIS